MKQNTITVFSALNFRDEFPALNSTTVFLDSAATSLKPKVMIEATDDYYRHVSSSVHRSQAKVAQQLTQSYELTRAQVAELINIDNAKNIIWTRGTTEAINLITQGYFRQHLQPGDEIIVSEQEHHSNLIPWLMVARQTGAKVVKWPVSGDHCIHIDTLNLLLNERTKVVAVTQMSNVTGHQPDLAAIRELTHRVKAKLVVDGAQGIAHHQIDLTALDIDFYVFSAHKLYGPTGLGVCYGKTALLEAMSPWQGGGKMLTETNFEQFIPAPIPHCFEAGTPNIAGVIGFSATLDWLNTIDRPASASYANSLIDYAEEQLSLLAGFISYRQPHSPLLAFNFADIHHSDIAMILAEQHIALRQGQHCAQPLMDAIGITGCLRISVMPYNNRHDIDHFIQAIKSALALLGE